MTEKKLQLKIFAGAVIVLICSGLYAWGGMELKFLRRYLAPIICATFLSVINREWLQLVKFPMLLGASCLGYGADTIGLKLWKRLYVGFTFSLGASVDKIVKRKWASVAFTFLSVIGVFMIYGVFNPVHARNEEFIIGAIIYTNAIIPAIKENEND